MQDYRNFSGLNCAGANKKYPGLHAIGTPVIINGTVPIDSYHAPGLNDCGPWAIGVPPSPAVVTFQAAPVPPIPPIPPAEPEDIFWEPNTLDMGGMVAWIAGDQSSTKGLDDVTSLTFSEAYNDEGYDIRNTATLIAVHFPNLVNMNWNSGGGYGLTVRQNPNLTTITIPSLVPAQVGGADPSIWFDENALSQATVDAILAQCVAAAGFTSGDLKLDGGTNSPPSSVAPGSDYDILTVRGVSVSVN